MTKYKKGKGGSELLYIAVGVAIGYFGHGFINNMIGQIKGMIPSFSGVARAVSPRDYFEYSNATKRYEYVHPY